MARRVPIKKKSLRPRGSSLCIHVVKNNIIFVVHKKQCCWLAHAILGGFRPLRTPILEGLRPLSAPTLQQGEL